MFSKTVQENGDETSLALSGALDENADFDLPAKSLHKIMRVDFKGVTHINSTGILRWTHFTKGLMDNGLSIILENCTPMIVEQINQVKSFAAGMQIASFEAPYFCKTCKKSENILFKNGPGILADIKDAKVPCPTCQAQMIFDDFPAEYLRFLKAGK